MTRRSFGNVRQQASGRWQVRYRSPDGRSCTGERMFDTRREAERHLAEITTKINQGNWTDPKARAITLESYAASWLEHRSELTTLTLELYAGLLRLHINPQLGGMPIGKITPAEVRKWRNGRLKVTGATRTRQAYSLLRTVLKTAVVDGLLPSNPCQEKGAGQSKSPERPYLSREDAEALAAAMPTPELRCSVLTTFWGCLRLGELLALRREDVVLVPGELKGLLHVHRAIARTKAGPVDSPTKTKKARTVHLPAQAVLELRAHLERTGPALPSARLFVHSSGRPLEAHHLRRAWTKARGPVKAGGTGLAEFHFHDLRHGGLTYFAQHGASLAEIMKRGGHSTVAAALIYQHAAEARDAELANRMSDVPESVAQVAEEGPPTG